ncbi:Quercetin 2,3-dioxygenase [Ephemeroptericola cinctiostellae]|uniref:Quercetin 2,3-dioxygenase n=1 Tax=Ephemeroptericola cinctiostellae TaxID=2268024 RepID=A0A345DBN1_9BURK|nr:pirin family protein [Ephemeroptericola cinctiostellae]AXF85769.1 Quercetin 2,3-dioxygenase [Ephemeroptericola cinctiostellae]
MITAQLQTMSRGHNFRAHALRSGSMAPFLGVDHAWMSAPTFPMHQHVGLSAVSYVFEDTQTPINNQDSLGNHNLIHAGGLHWAAAGRGIRHQEDPLEIGKTVHQLQIFVDLADEKKSDAPFVLSLDAKDIPVVKQNGVRVRVPLGSYGSAHSPLTPPTEVNLFDISLDDGAVLIVPIAAGHNAFVMPIVGTVTINGAIFESNQSAIPIFAAQNEAHTIELHTQHGKAQIVVFSGAPI